MSEDKKGDDILAAIRGDNEMPEHKVLVENITSAVAKYVLYVQFNGRHDGIELDLEIIKASFDMIEEQLDGD